jgi:hypothetical protein
MAERNTGVPQNKRIEFRVGVHLSWPQQLRQLGLPARE